MRHACLQPSKQARHVSLSGRRASALVPGGYRFGDYWRMGLPLEAIVIGVSVPTILLFWPL